MLKILVTIITLVSISLFVNNSFSQININPIDPSHPEVLGYKYYGIDKEGHQVEGSITPTIPGDPNTNFNIRGLNNNQYESGTLKLKVPEHPEFGYELKMEHN